MPLKVLVRISEFSNLTSYHSLSHKLLYTPFPALTLPPSSIDTSCPYMVLSYSRFYYGLFSCLFPVSVHLFHQAFKNLTRSKCFEKYCGPPKGSPPLFLIISRLVSRVRSHFTGNKDIWSNVQKEITPNRKKQKQKQKIQHLHNKTLARIRGR